MQATGITRVIDHWASCVPTILFNKAKTSVPKGVLSGPQSRATNSNGDNVMKNINTLQYSYQHCGRTTRFSWICVGTSSVVSRVLTEPLWQAGDNGEQRSFCLCSHGISKVFKKEVSQLLAVTNGFWNVFVCFNNRLIVKSNITQFSRIRRVFPHACSGIFGNNCSRSR